MPNYSTLTDAEINAKLAEKMGYQPSTSTPGQWLVPISKNNNAIRAFSPCASRDDLAVVVGHMIASGMHDNLNETLHHVYCTRLDHREELQPVYSIYLLTCPPRIIAEACLEVLEG